MKSIFPSFRGTVVDAKDLLRGIVFTRSVCLSVCVSVCVSVCPANILVFYLSAIRRDLDLKFIQDTYGVVLNSLKKM